MSVRGLRRALKREIPKSPYYRRRPHEAIRYLYVRWRTSRQQLQSAESFLAQLGLDIGRALEGYSLWEPILNGVISREKELDGGAGIHPDEGKVLYGLVRALRPQNLVETGVAGGVSTAFLCAALIENEVGKLVSIDLPPEEAQGRMHDDGGRMEWPKRGIGWAIPDVIRERMEERHSIVLEDVVTALPRVIDDLGIIDFFLHDDVHTPPHMLWEFRLLWPRLGDGGALASDDINSGWSRFCKEIGKGDRRFRNCRRLGVVIKQ
jgi:hypothetical protein